MREESTAVVGSWMKCLAAVILGNKVEMVSQVAGLLLSG